MFSNGPSLSGSAPSDLAMDDSVHRYQNLSAQVFAAGPAAAFQVMGNPV